jgi:antitoxin VapB
MLNLSHETETLAARLAEAQRLPVDVAVRQALEAQARVVGVPPVHQRRRMTVEQMLELGAEIAALPVLDTRSPNEIMDDINAL